ncbi:sigma-70 family RNA polymerase sigma factor [Oscillibacter sp.]|uniref:sigma-70 family RNA polymerase sigma factor n=1 Tax=Oscillibacter sp. TaxID=1945593 RepID=UPI002899FD50|nr:sigma-70 family RNA polymerase sigma factor [Oscillibacter sp.]
MSHEILIADIQRGQKERLPELWGTVRNFAVRQANRRLAAYRANNTGCAVDVEDLLQEGFLAMVEAAETFKAGGRMSFLGWWDFRLKTAFNDALGVRSKRTLNEPVHQCAQLSQSVAEGEGATLGDFLPADNEDFQTVEGMIWRAQLHTTLQDALGELTQAQRDILFQRFYEGRTRAQIARQQGVTREAIRMQEVRALAAMRKTRAAGRLAEFAQQAQ